MRFVVVVLVFLSVIILTVTAGQEPAPIPLDEPVVIVSEDGDASFTVTDVYIVRQTMDTSADDGFVHLSVLGEIANNTGGERCFRARRTRLIDSEGNEYAPQNGLMDDTRSALDRDFMGAYRGHCLPDGEIAETFVTFNARYVYVGDGFTLRFMGTETEIVLPFDILNPPPTQTPVPLTPEEEIARIVVPHVLSGEMPEIEIIEDSIPADDDDEMHDNIIITYPLNREPDIRLLSEHTGIAQAICAIQEAGYDDAQLTFHVTVGVIDFDGNRFTEDAIAAIFMPDSAETLCYVHDKFDEDRLRELFDYHAKLYDVHPLVEDE